MAQRTTAARKSTKKKKTDDIVIEIDGRKYARIPLEQLTPEQDDRASALMIRNASSFKTVGEGDDQESAMLEIAATLVENSAYRTMLGIYFWPIDEPFDPDRIPENIRAFRGVRFDTQQRLPIAFEAVKAFFASGAS